jgi:hypothetical protein
MYKYALICVGYVSDTCLFTPIFYLPNYRDKVERKVHNGRTFYECHKDCLVHCRSNMRQASAPTGLRVVQGATTGSTISVSWHAPLDTGDR